MSVPDANDELRTFQLLQQAKTAALTDAQAADLQLAENDRTGKRAPILVVDDSVELRTLMVFTLLSLGYENIAEAGDGREALAQLRTQSFALVILDIEMPVLNGFEVLRQMQLDPGLRQISVIVTSGLHELDAVVRCIELGAEDFLPKPVNGVLLRARISSSLERTRLRERERLRLIELQREKAMLEAEQEKSDRLLLNILPAVIADRLKHGEDTIADRYADVTVLFADLVGFTALVNRLDPDALVSLLNDLFTRFDRLAIAHGVEKIKTIGDCYLVVGGLPEGAPNHVEAVADFGFAILAEVAEMNRERSLDLSLRIGMNTGPVVAGVIGRHKFAYDLWGGTVNLASRMQTTGLPDRIHLPLTTCELLKERYEYSDCGAIDCKGIGEVATGMLDGRRLSVTPADQTARG